MIGMIIFAAFILAGLFLFASAEKVETYKHQCDVNGLLNESYNRQARKRNHIYSSALIYKKI